MELPTNNKLTLENLLKHSKLISSTMERRVSMLKLEDTTLTFAINPSKNTHLSFAFDNFPDDLIFRSLDPFIYISPNGTKLEIVHALVTSVKPPALDRSQKNPTVEFELSATILKIIDGKQVHSEQINHFEDSWASHLQPWLPAKKVLVGHTKTEHYRLIDHE